MAFLSPRAGDFVLETTNTAGTFNTFTLLGPVTVGAFTYSKVSDIYADGETLYYVRSQAVSAGVRAIFESGRGTYNHAANTITPTVGSNSSNMAAGSSTFVPVTWGAGVQNVICVPDAASLITAETLVAVIGLNANAIRAALLLGTAALLDTGTTSGKIPVIGTTYPPPAHTHGSLVAPYTGGANNKIHRYNGSGTVIEANAVGSPPDSPARLSYLFVRGSDGVLYLPGSTVPLTGVVAGTQYFLGTSGVWGSTPIVVDGTHTHVEIGFGLDTNVLGFYPSKPVSGNLGSAVNLKFEGGTMKL